MKKFQFLVQSLVLIAGVSGLTACTPTDAFESLVPVDHRAYACENFGEMRAVWTSADADFDEARASVAALGGVMAVWQTEQGEEDPLYWKISRYTQDFTAMLIETTPETARAYFATEDEVLADIETECLLPNTYVAPLTIHGGCWNYKGAKAELQSRYEGKWIKEQSVGQLSKISYCDDPEYPWGVTFTERRVIEDGTQTFRIIWRDATGDTFASGKYKHVSCPVDALTTDTEISLWWNDCNQ